MTCKPVTVFFLSVTLASMATAETLTCQGAEINVFSETAVDLSSVCVLAEASLAKLARCNVVLDRPVRIEIVDELSPGCMGLYHCGDDHIEILSPAAMTTLRSGSASLGYLEAATYFQSIITHELAHAAYEAVECPFDNCHATSEYVANTMQLMCLPPDDIAAFEAGLDMKTHVSREDFSGILYLMAPDAFLRDAWVHLNQRPDPCAYISDIMAGRTHFERHRP